MEAEEEEREVDFVVGVYPAKEISLKREGKGYKMVHIAFLYHRLLGRPLAGTFFFWSLSLSLLPFSPFFFAKKDNNIINSPLYENPFNFSFWYQNCYKGMLPTEFYIQYVGYPRILFLYWKS